MTSSPTLQKTVLSTPIRRSLARRRKFDALEFLAALSVCIPKTYESLTRYYGRYSYERRGERVKLTPPPAEETKSDYRRDFDELSRVDFGQRSTERSTEGHNTRHLPS